MSVTEFKRGVPTYKDKDDNEFGLLCETKEVCVTDNEGVSLEYKLQTLMQNIASLTSELQSCAKASDLSNYLPKDGSVPLDRLLTIGASSTDKYVALLLNNLNRSLEFGITQGGVIQLHDATNKKNVFTSALDGTNTFNGVATGNLPLNGGGEVTKAFAVPFKIKNTSGNSAYISYSGKDGVLGSLGMGGENIPVYLDKDGNTKTLLHTGNSAKVVVSQTAPSDTSALWVW